MPHHLQLRPRDTVERLQLRKNRRSHEQCFWESEYILSVENTRRLIKYLLIDPKQRRISRSIPLKLHSERSDCHQSEAIDAISDLSWQGEEWAIWRHLTYEWARGLVDES